MQKRPAEIIEKTPKKRHIVRKVLFFLTFASLVVTAFNVFLLFRKGVIMLNNPPRSKYQVRGADISVRQGEIDWGGLSAQGFEFLYIKATEGAFFKDSQFEKNHKGSEKTSLLTGFYHCFSFDASAKNQADNFISTVGHKRKMLPPVIKVELYGKFRVSKPDESEVSKKLSELVDAFEAEYGAKPIIFCTEEVYGLYIKGRFEGYPIWIRSVYHEPSKADYDWLFWQYTDRAGGGFTGLSVFSGTLSELKNMMI